MERSEFEKLVAEAIDTLPDHIHKRINNVAVVIEDLPERGQTSLLGLYEGIPQTKRGLGYNLVLPDKITIFKRNIERIARTPDEIKRQVRQTVWHEVAHYFGYDDEGIDNLSKKQARPKNG